MNPVNQELKDYRVLIEHYTQILKEDNLIKKGEMENTDNRPLLSEEDIVKINLKLESLNEQRNILLFKEDDYNEVL